MIWVITGATGLIGRALVRRLLDQGERVLALSRTAGAFFHAWPQPNLLARNYDLAADAPQELARLDDDVSLVMLSSIISMSADLRDLGPTLAVDTYGHLRLAERLESVLRHGVYASSCTVYGAPAHLPVTESAPVDPLNVYALTKLTSERALGAVFERLSVPFCACRIAQVYGPGAPLSGALYTFLKLAARGGYPRITCNPDAFRDYCHVSDVIDGLLAAVNRRAGGIYNLGSGSATTIAALARHCLAAAGRTDEPEVEPRVVAGDMLLDIRRARRDLGYAPQVGIAEGVAREYQRLYGQPSAERG